MNVKRQIEINASSEKVYEAITTAAGIHGWWSHNSAIALEVGSEHIMYFVKEGHSIVMKFRVDEMNANKSVVWTCTENGNPAWVGTRIYFELATVDGKTQVSFTHADWDEKFKGTPLYVSVPPTWDAFMGSLKNYCETGVGQPW